MIKTVSTSIRSLCIFAVLALALQVLQPSRALASGVITISPSSGPAGTVVTVTGSGFAPGENVNLYFAGNFSQSVVATGGAFSTNITVPNVTPNTYAVTAIASSVASAPFTVTTSTTGSGLSIAKYVTVNGLGYSTNNVARNGDTLTYNFLVTNNTGTTATAVTITDTIQVGQTVFNSTGAPCTYDSPSRTVLCTLGDIPAGTSRNVFISATVDPNFSGTLLNTARTQGTNTFQATSNTTSVTVNGPTGIITGNLRLCGIVTAYTPATTLAFGTITINGVTIALAPYAFWTGAPVVLGSNVCVVFALNGSGQATALSITPNLATVYLVCGIYTVGALPGYMFVGGMPFGMVPGTSFVGFIVPLQVYCFLTNSSGFIYGLLSGIPTSVHLMPTHAVHRTGMWIPV